jgi:hypothetical protein
MSGFWILIWVLVGVAVARMLARENVPALAARQQLDELAKLREEMDQLQAEVARLGEEQAFLTRLLASGEAPAATAEDEPGPRGPNDKETP